MISSDRYLLPDVEPALGHSPTARQQIELPSTPGIIFVQRALMLSAGLFVFVLALELLKTGASSYGRTLIALLQISSPANALGLGWLLAYFFLSGSPVAAVSITFFASGTISALQTFTMITGSRLGAAFVVFLIGYVYFLRDRRRTAGLAIGVLALLTTAAIYIPALLPGYWLLASGWLSPIQVAAQSPLTSFFDTYTAPAVALASQLLPPWGVLLGAIALLIFAFQLIDRALPDAAAQRQAVDRIGRLAANPLALFLLGAAVTSVTLSVSVSLAVLVPLAARGLLRREQTIPYIMGANITTFVDTLIAALLIGGPAAFTIVLVEMVSVAGLSLLVLCCAYGPFARALLGLQERITARSSTLLLFVGVLLLVPLGLILW